MMPRAQSDERTVAVGGDPRVERRRSWWRPLLRHRGATIGAVLVFLAVLVAVMAPWIAPADPNKQNLRERYRRPAWDNPLGTDHYGRDVLSRVLYGARASLAVGVVAVGFGLVVGSFLGLSAGYYGGTVDAVIMRIMDMLLAFPMLLLALLIMAVLGASLLNVMLAIGISSVPNLARLMRSVVLSVREQEYVQAGRALGGADRHIMQWHIVPNTVTSVIVLATLMIARAILVESNLSFLGLGVPPPDATWGSMISEGQHYLQKAPWIVASPGFATLLTVLGFNLLGDGLRDLYDPRLRRLMR